MGVKRREREGEGGREGGAAFIHALPDYFERVQSDVGLVTKAFAQMHLKTIQGREKKSKDLARNQLENLEDTN